MSSEHFNHETEEFINDYVKALRSGNAAVFAGAGLSVKSGYFDWKRLLTPVAVKLQLDINEEYDLAALAQYFVDNKGGIRNQLTQILTDEFRKSGITHSENHEILARLPIGIYWTTNYDNLIESALEKAGKKPDVKFNHAHLSVNITTRDAIVYKMHGDMSDLANTVLTKHEYEDYNKHRELFSNAFKADFVARNMLFLGFSFSDPNLDYLMSRVRSIMETNTKHDYYFIKKESDPKKYNRQMVRVRSLERYGLFAVWVEDYPDITIILREIERRYLRSSIFISGSAAEYGDFRDPTGFVEDLATALAQKGYKIVTGFGKRVGSYVVTGVLRCMENENTYRLDQYIKMRPFPKIHEGDESAIKTKARYRSSIIKEAGVAIFLFGNKRIDGNNVIAPGVLEEFELARSHELKIIPLGATGYASKHIYETVMSSFSDYYKDPSLRSLFEKLDQKDSPDTLIDTVLKILSTINKF